MKLIDNDAYIQSTEKKKTKNKKLPTTGTLTDKVRRNQKMRLKKDCLMKDILGKQCFKRQMKKVF